MGEIKRMKNLPFPTFFPCKTWTPYSYHKKFQSPRYLGHLPKQHWLGKSISGLASTWGWSSSDSRELEEGCGVAFLCSKDRLASLRAHKGSENGRRIQKVGGKSCRQIFVFKRFWLFESLVWRPWDTNWVIIHSIDSKRWFKTMVRNTNTPSIPHPPSDHHERFDRFSYFQFWKVIEMIMIRRMNSWISRFRTTFERSKALESG